MIVPFINISENYELVDLTHKTRNRMLYLKYVIYVLNFALKDQIMFKQQTTVKAFVVTPHEMCEILIINVFKIIFIV